MDRSAFATLLKNAILGAWAEFVRAHPADNPYAFTLITGQVGNYLAYAIASEKGLRRVVAEYETLRYRYQSTERESFNNQDKLSIWLRWANPDDGWQFGDFPLEFQVQAALASLVQRDEFGRDAEGLEEFCIDVLRSIQNDSAWQPWSDRIVVGVTYGADPRDFLRTATRASPYPLVQKLWGEYWKGEEMSRRIPAPK